MEESILYIKHELTPEIQKLHKLATGFKRHNNYKNSWTNGEKIFLRKTDTSRIIHVNYTYRLDELPNKTLTSPKNLN